MPADATVDVDPRITRSRQRIRAAALAEFADKGYGGFAIEPVAERAGVARSTIYRHWSDRLALLADALGALGEHAHREPGGDVEPRARVRELLTHFAGVLADPLVGRCVVALIDGAQRDARVAAFYHDFNTRRRGSLVDAIAQGVRSGAFAAGTDPDIAAVALAGAILYRRVMTPDPVGDADIDALLALVLGA